MVINIKDLDKLIQKQIVDAFGQKSLNDEVAEFQGQLPCLENLIFVLKDRLCGANNEILITDHVGQTKSVKLTKLKCYEMEDLWAEWTNKEMTITRSYEFAAAHRLYIASMSNEENDRIFGKCSNPNGHGHNYVVEVTIGGKPDPVTGMILNLEEIDCIVERDLLAVLDHKNLNMDVSELSDVPTTTENLTLYVFEKLHQSFGDKLRKVRVLETARSAFEVSAT